jgi:hypothetical protein
MHIDRQKWIGVQLTTGFIIGAEPALLYQLHKAGTRRTRSQSIVAVWPPQASIDTPIQSTSGIPAIALHRDSVLPLIRGAGLGRQFDLDSSQSPDRRIGSA